MTDEDWYNRRVNRHWLVEFFRWDARTILAAVLGLAVLIGFAWAATENSLLMTFDFGGATASDVQSGAIPVKGGASVYPKISGIWQYGWVNSSISEYVDKTVVDKIKRDYNSGDDGANFRISGLEPGNYSFKATVGASNVALSTKMQSGALATSVTTAPGSWSVATLNLTVDNSGTVDLIFSSSNQVASWGISGLAVYTASGVTAEPGFVVTLTPSQKTMRVGDTGVFALGITPTNNYASQVSAQVSGLVTGITAELTPSQISNLPGVMELRVFTDKAVAPTIYDLTVTVRGNDPSAIQKTLNLRLNLVAVNSIIPMTNETVTNSTTGTSGGAESLIPDLPPRTAKETKEDFAKVETFAAEQKAKLAQENNLTEMKGIGSDLTSGVSVYTDLPKPVSVTESLLQRMVGAGIIGTLSDAAPPVQAKPEPPGFWQKVFQGIFKQAS
jgi:hypothetical protein